MNTHLRYLPIILSVVLSFASCQKPETPSQPETVAVTGVQLSAATATLTEGETKTLTATVTPSNADNKKVTWSSSNASVATVSEGVVTAVKAGSATITVTTVDGGKTATCAVTVNAKTYAVESVSLDKTELALTEGDSQSLTATVKPDNASNKNVKWSSSDETVASVDAGGKISALKAGTATITVKTEDGGKTATCAVTVNAKTYPVESVSLNKTELTLTEGDSETLTATVKPDNATNKNVKWSSSNEAVATVSDEGKVNALKAGSATITVTTEDGEKTATCAVTVNAKVYPVESVSLNRTELTLTEGDNYTLTATVNPDNATNKNVKWSSSDEAVATVDAEGKISALKIGSVTITVTTEDGGKTATCAVTVTEKTFPVESVSLDKTEITLLEGESATLTATVKPDNASNKNVKWSSSDKTVATVDAEGKVSALKIGSATITVTTVDGGKTATCQVTVNTNSGLEDPIGGGSWEL